jgi:16S rRNA (guanine966-N2)-methyltransferase
MTLKILGGSLKGKDIKIPKTRETRPVTSLLRKSMFDTCQFYIENARVLDLFAGSGAIGIEALSRGARFCLFVDLGELQIKCIRENLEKLELRAKSAVLREDAFKFLNEFERDPFDILFVDPPYPIGLEGYSKLLTLLKESHAVDQNSIIFIEAPSIIVKEFSPIVEENYVIRKQKKNSTTTLLQIYLKPLDVEGSN